MNAADYEFLCEFLLKSSGLSLGENKEYLIDSRLTPLAQSWELEDVSQLIAELRDGRNFRLRDAVTQAMTTNETSFFRDKKPFDDLKTVILPELIKQRQLTRELRIWSAATSTGQEAYSIAMLLEEEFPELCGWTVEVLATDIDQTALERAQEGVYSQFEVQRGLPVKLLMKHFSQVSGKWQIKPELRERITWKELNLLDDFSTLGPFDVIFCRNVLIYFENQTKQDTFRRLSRTLREDGYLLLGAAETTFGNCKELARANSCESGVYQRIASASATA